MPDMTQTPPPPGGRPSSPDVARRRWVQLILLAAAVTGTLAGLLSQAADHNTPGAVLTGGAAFAGTASLLLAIAHYAGPE
jgi:hypothetical protein